jgi:hypothetical protein
MTSEALAILGLIGTFIVPFIVLYIERKDEQKLLIKINGDRKKAIEGTWQGTYIDATDNNSPTSMEIEFKVGKKKISGVATYFDIKVQKNRILSVEGGFRNDRFLILTYSNAEILQFGTMILELKPTNDKLIGNYLGFGHNRERIVLGNLSLEKKVSGNN